MTITVQHPDTTRTEKTFLSASLAAAATALTVQSNDSFAQNDFIIIGVIGQEQTEIRKISSVSGGTTINVSSAVTFSHPTNTPITLVKYDQVKVQSATTEGGSYSDISGSPFAIDADKQFTTVEDASGTTSTWYKIAYYNSQTTTLSAYSDAIQGSGVKRGSARQLISQVRRNLTLVDDTLVNDEDILAWFNEALNDIQSRKGWPKTEESATSSSQVDTAIYTLPSDLLMLKNVRITSGSVYYYPEYKSQEDFALLRTTSGTTTSIPSYYTLWEEQIEFWPGFAATGTNDITYYYYKQLPYLDSDNDVPSISNPELLVFYACMMISAKRSDKEAVTLWSNMYENKLSSMIRNSGGLKQKTRFMKVRRPGVDDSQDRFKIFTTSIS